MKMRKGNRATLRFATETDNQMVFIAKLIGLPLQRGEVISYVMQHFVKSWAANNGVSVEELKKNDMWYYSIKNVFATEKRLRHPDFSLEDFDKNIEEQYKEMFRKSGEKISGGTKIDISKIDFSGLEE